MHGVRFRSAIWFRSAIPIPKPNPIRIPNHNPTLNPITNPIPNRNPNITVSLTLSQPNAKCDARTKKYLAVVRNYCSTKTTHLQAEHKYTTKANLCIHLQTSDHSCFWYNVNKI